MTSIDFLNKVHKILDSQEYNLSYSPAKSKNYMLYCNGNFSAACSTRSCASSMPTGLANCWDTRNPSTVATPVPPSTGCW